MSPKCAGRLWMQVRLRFLQRKDRNAVGLIQLGQQVLNKRLKEENDREALEPLPVALQWRAALLARSLPPQRRYWSRKRRDARVRDREPLAQAGEPVGLGEGTEHRDVLALAVVVDA